MKKYLTTLLVLAMITGLASCSKTQQTETTENDPTETGPSETTEKAQDGDTKMLVLYFSRTGEQYGVGVIEKGNTAIAAEMIADLTGADLYEIVPAEDNYPTTYKELTDVAKKEQNENARPAYADTLPDLSDYSVIFIGAPVWWGDWPMIMYTFFENEDLSNRTLIPFCTNAGSGLSGFDRKLAAACPDSKVLDGLAIVGADAQNKPESIRDMISEWISDLDY